MKQYKAMRRYKLNEFENETAIRIKMKIDLPFILLWYFPCSLFGMHA